jgi:hypothetical protein
VLIKISRDLWKCIIATHGINSISHVPGVIKQAAWEQYVTYRQGGFESLITYREQFETVLKAYVDQGNATLSVEDSAMHFFMGLDAGRYAQIKTTVHNNMTMGTQLPPKTVNDYTIAANWIKAPSSA